MIIEIADAIDESKNVANRVLNRWNATMYHSH